MITDIDGMFGFCVSGPSKKSPSKHFVVSLPDMEGGFITWTPDKEEAIKDMESFVKEAHKALETLYGYPGGGGSAPPLRAVPDPTPVPAGQMSLEEAA